MYKNFKLLSVEFRNKVTAMPINLFVQMVDLITSFKYKTRLQHNIGLITLHDKIEALVLKYYIISCTLIITGKTGETETDIDQIFVDS